LILENPNEIHFIASAVIESKDTKPQFSAARDREWISTNKRSDTGIFLNNGINDKISEINDNENFTTDLVDHEVVKN
jgi:hypothetical protein